MRSCIPPHPHTHTHTDASSRRGRQSGRDCAEGKEGLGRLPSLLPCAGLQHSQAQDLH